jgi:hypothetical protein
MGVLGGKRLMAELVSHHCVFTANQIAAAAAAASSYSISSA